MNMRITGVVLAGGTSSRLGQDKGRLTFGASGVDMVTRTARLLRRVVPDVLIIGREHGEFPYLHDDVPGAGPVGAVTTALRHTRSACFVISCDLPFMDAATLTLLRDARRKRRPETMATAFIHEDTGRREHLAAIYELSALQFFEPRLRDNLLKIAWIVPEWLYTLVPVPADAGGKFFNINRPEDLRRAEKTLAGLSGWGCE